MMRFFCWLLRYTTSDGDENGYGEGYRDETVSKPLHRCGTVINLMDLVVQSMGPR